MIAEIADVTVGYGDVPVLHGVSVGVAKEEIVAIIGPNGAGKSTALKAMLGYLKPKKGRIVFGGRDITGWPTHEIVRAGLGYVPQGRIVFGQMTVEENLEMGAYSIVKDRTRVHKNLGVVYELFPRLAQRKEQRAGTMSGGEQQMLTIARALMAEPQVLLMDEPSLGLAPKFVSLIFQKIRELKHDLGTAMMIVEQNAAQALSIADRGYVLELGRNRFEGTGESLLHDPKVKELYLGGSVK